MQIVIDIPEGILNTIQADEMISREQLAVLQMHILNGAPLPEGHGRLVDETELLKMTDSYKSELGRLKADPFVKCGIETVERFIKEMPPIIKADKQTSGCSSCPRSGSIIDGYVDCPDAYKEQSQYCGLNNKEG